MNLQTQKPPAPPHRLQLATLQQSRIERPSMDPREISVGQVHLGLGAFHRAHQAMYTQVAMSGAADPSWGICGVSSRSRGVVDALAEQDGLFTVQERSLAEESVRLCQSIRAWIPGAAEPERVLQTMAAATTSIVTVTVTERGYRRSGVSGELDVADPEVLADLGGRLPTTTVGQLARAIAQRCRQDSGPLTVISCDNLPSNGSVLGRLVRDFVERAPDMDPSVAPWLSANVSFPSTVVDRIVPATTQQDIARATSLVGLRDEATVVAEPYSSWIIQNRIVSDRPAWERAGALFVEDTEPYELMKLRMLNGAHSGLAYLGGLRGYEFIAEAVQDELIARFVRAMMVDEAARTIAVPDGIDAAAYADEVLRRFRNPALRHRTAQVGSDGSLKLPIRILSTMSELRRNGAVPRLTSLVVAAWLQFVVGGADEHGICLAVSDPAAEQLRQARNASDDTRALVGAVLRLAEVFPPSLAEDAVIAEQLEAGLDDLSNGGVAVAIGNALES
jgi:fructuronate reductase